MFPFRQIQGVQGQGLAERERQRTTKSITLLGSWHRSSHLSSEQVCEVSTIILFSQLRKMRLRQRPVQTQMQGSSKLQPTSSVLPSLGGLLGASPGHKARDVRWSAASLRSLVSLEYTQPQDTNISIQPLAQCPAHIRSSLNQIGTKSKYHHVNATESTVLLDTFRGRKRLCVLGKSGKASRQK